LASRSIPTEIGKEDTLLGFRVFNKKRCCSLLFYHNKTVIARRLWQCLATSIMSKSQSEACPFQAKDNLWYPSYREKVAANIKHNNEVLERLGLDKYQKNEVKTKSPRKKRETKSPSVPSRSSKRIRNAPPELVANQTSLEALENLEDRVQPKKKIHRHTVPKKYETLTEAELQKLKKQFEKEQRSNKDHDEKWMEEMNVWMLTEPHGTGDTKKTVSTANARTVMRQVRKLVVDAMKGKGVEYSHWHPKVSFCWWKPVPPDPEDDDDSGYKSKDGNKKPSQHIFICNLQDIYNLAQEMENTHGKDLGNGWLLLHPIRKLQLFQEYYFRRNVAKSA
jgi:hypothetical protein